MKNYTITVNGTAYDVAVEEAGAVSAQTAAAPVKQVAQTTAAPVAVPIKKAAGGGNVKIESGAAGKIFKVEASVGQTVAKGDTIIVIEAMKMEIPVVAPENGIVASIDVAVGDAIEAGAVLATLN